MGWGFLLLLLPRLHLILTLTLTPYPNPNPNPRGGDSPPRAGAAHRNFERVQAAPGHFPERSARFLNLGQLS